MPECAFTGFKRLIVFICETTQFIVLFGSRFGTALETAVALIQLMGWFDMPESIHSDNGSENDNYVWLQMQQITGFKHTFSMPHIPQSNGIAERNIGTTKQFLRNLSVDIGRHNSWGLLLPIAQKGLNDLPRQELQWLSPSQIILASCHDLQQFAIPTFYQRPLREIDFADAEAYPISGNFGHRAMVFQQAVFNHFYEMKQQAFDAAQAKDPTDKDDLQPGQAVLIDWPGDPPSPMHPRKRGPYRVVEILRNVVLLQHLVVPPPDEQPASLKWSKQAQVYTYLDAHVPQRSDADPSASQVAADFSGRNIECVLSHRRLRSASRQSTNIRDFEYQCRLATSDATTDEVLRATRFFHYDEIKHTFALDCYAAANRVLTGHTPVMHMPITWNPHAVTKSFRPSHAPRPIHEFFQRHDSDSADTSDVNE